MTASSTILDPPKIPGDFGFSPEHELAQTEARRFLTERCPISEIRRLAAEERGFDPALFQEIAKLGWLGLTVPEERGGLGLDSLHQALLLEEMGRVLLPAPYFGAFLALRAILAAGSSAQIERLVPSIVSGERVATIALSEPGGSWEPGDVSTTATKTSSGYALRGVKTHVLFGAAADLVVVPAKEDDGRVTLFVVPLPSKGATLTNEAALDSTRRTARLELDGVMVSAADRLESDGLAALVAVHLAGAAFLASEMVGGIERTLGITRDYAATRIQFGRPIGAFQAVKHPIVDMMIGCEQARSLALGAAVALDRDPASSEMLARSAKAYASDAYLFAVKKGVQLHGGFGFTWDCDVHFYFKRAMWSRGTLGDGVFHRRKIADALFGGVPIEAFDEGIREHMRRKHPRP